jgi:hypothetical protein
MKFLVTFALAAVAFASAPQALKAADPLCPRLNATVHGTYVLFGTGTFVGLGPLTAVGELTYDGAGNTTATYTRSVNGSIQQGVTVTGTYTVNPDCTGSHAESDGSHYDFVAHPDGSVVTFIETDAGLVVSGTEVRLKPTDAEDAALVGPRNSDAQQVPLGRTSPESLSIALLAPENARSNRFPSCMAWLPHLDGHHIQVEV